MAYRSHGCHQPIVLLIADAGSLQEHRAPATTREAL